MCAHSERVINCSGRSSTRSDGFEIINTKFEHRNHNQRQRHNYKRDHLIMLSTARINPGSPVAFANF